MAQVRVAGTTFTPREAPDAASYVRRAISSSPYPYVARVRYFAASDVVAQVFPTASVHIEADGPDTCIVTTGADDPERMVPWLAMPGCDFEVLEPPEVVAAVRTVAGRIARAVAGGRRILLADEPTGAIPTADGTAAPASAQQSASARELAERAVVVESGAAGGDPFAEPLAGVGEVAMPPERGTAVLLGVVGTQPVQMQR